VTPTVSAIVVAFGKERLLGECLRSLETASARIAGGVEIIVVLNQLAASARAALKSEWVVVESGGNVGFAAGVTTGLARARGKWIALVNDDCVLAPGALEELLAAGESSDDIGSVAAQIRFANQADTINSAGVEVDVLGVAYERLLGQPASAGSDTVQEVFGASAAAALYRRTMLDDVGGFDASFFAYLEDADLAWRARMRGWRCVYAPGAIVLHEHSSTLGHRSPAKYFLVGRNRVRMLAKNATRSQLIRHGLAAMAYDVAYVGFVAARDRTLAPLRGRLRGLHEWRRYRATGTPVRRHVPLVPSAGFRRALGRDHTYDAG
jgi:GT2 family glycosyltransferase